MELFERARAELLRSNADRRHPFQYFTLATFGEYPEARTVVNRGITPGLSVLFFTDSRTPKVRQIRSDDKVSALFYHPKKKLQIRLYGRAGIIDEGAEAYSELLHRVKQSGNTKDYTTRLAPGSEVEEVTRAIFGEEMHFLAIRIHPHYVDILQLGRDSHQRRGYTLENGKWKEAVLVP